mgnify:CR=1 FL=1
MDSKKKTGEGLYKKRYATLKEHRAAVAAQKAMKGGKNVGPVAHGDSYASAIKKKPAAKKPAAKKPAAKKPAPKKVAAKKPAATTKKLVAPKKTAPKKPTAKKTTSSVKSSTPTVSKTAARRQARRSSTTPQQRALKALERGKEKNRKEALRAERQRTFRSGRTYNSYSK